VDLSAQYIVDNKYAPILTLSYGECENALGTAGNAFWEQLWEQAASEGISVFVASGDSGAAGCDAVGGKTATGGRAVSGIASTPYNTCVGGTMFSGDSSNDPNSYWLANDTSLYAETAKGYIPETVWNETSAANGIAGSGGGASTIYARPAWQVAYGVPASPLMRLVPDVAFNAAGGHDPYLVIQDGQAYGVGGTSVPTPCMAGIMALVVQRFGWQGNANFTIYSLGKAQYNDVYASGPAAPAVFHNITTGSNSVTGVVGYYATGGYSETTGLGSLDAAVLVSNWAPALNPITVTPLPATLTVVSGQSHTFSGSATENGAPLTYSWDFGDGTIAPGASLSHTYTITGNQPQVFWAVLTVSDGTYVQSSSTQVTVTPPSPVSAAIVLPVTSVSVLPNIPIAFAATASTSANGAAITSYAWSFGDKFTGFGATTSHSFADSANSFYTVALTATDSLGNTGTASIQIYADTSVMDVAGNGTVDVRDLLAIAGAWGVTATPTNFNGIDFAADLNGAAGITDTDLTLWMTYFVPEVIQ
jgi:hypothetical protein